MNMVDRNARDKLAELFRQFLAGRLENFDFEDKVPDSNDPAIYEIWWRAAWPLYDDFKTHRLTGDWRIPNESRREFARVILFLKSNIEYTWPRVTGLKPYHVSLLSLVTLGLYGKWYRKQHSKGFDKEVWPFTYSADLHKANSSPPYLSGTNA